MNILLGDIMAILCLLRRQPKRTMCGLGLQRSFGRNILEILVYYLMPNKCKHLKRRLVDFLSHRVVNVMQITHHGKAKLARIDAKCSAPWAHEAEFKKVPLVERVDIHSSVSLVKILRRSVA